MHAPEKTRQRTTCALLGGSGLRPAHSPRRPRAPALCLPWLDASTVRSCASMPYAGPQGHGR